MMKLPNFINRAKHILNTNRAVLNDFYDSREELQVSPSESGTTSFPRLMRGNVDKLYEVLTQKYDAAVVPGKFFESPQHFRIGMCADPASFATGIDCLGQALDQISS
jgi:aspartate/methionine/tyrosine aminotransferase